MKIRAKQARDAFRVEDLNHKAIGDAGLPGWRQKSLGESVQKGDVRASQAEQGFAQSQPSRDCNDRASMGGVRTGRCKPY